MESNSVAYGPFPQYSRTSLELIVRTAASLAWLKPYGWSATKRLVAQDHDHRGARRSCIRIAARDRLSTVLGRILPALTLQRLQAIARCFREPVTFLRMLLPMANASAVFKAVDTVVSGGSGSAFGMMLRPLAGVARHPHARQLRQSHHQRDRGQRPDLQPHPMALPTTQRRDAALRRRWKLDRRRPLAQTSEADQALRVPS